MKPKGKSNFYPNNFQRERSGNGKKVQLLGTKFNDAKIDKGSFNLMEAEQFSRHSGVISGISYNRDKNI